ncbi:MAG: GTP-binding protein, partial [Desulfuromonadaceae bacterium]
MKFITVSGPPSSGKTAVILQAIKALQQQHVQVGVVKFDCLATDDDQVYARYGVPVRTGLAGPLCPDHYFVSNIEECLEWGRSQKLDMLISESAGLCNRCSPHIEKITAVCVIDNLSGIGTPKKIGPMLKTADIVIITKGDIVSQAEREVFASRVAQVNPAALIMHINGITGQGAYELSTILNASETPDELQAMGLRYSMPSALCS